MSVQDALVFGFIATTALTAVTELSQAAGLSRMSLPYLLGTIFTPDRRRAPVLGIALHFVNGLIFAIGYALTFEIVGRATWWIGAMLGVVHTSLVLSLIAYLPSIHPRMATEREGPSALRALQPPGYLALNYGVGTPLVALVAHIAYGVVLGAFYGVH